MRIAVKNNDIKGRNNARTYIRSMVEMWRLGTTRDYLDSVDLAKPPPPAPVVQADVAPVSVFDNSRELAGLVEKALVKSGQILDLPIPDGRDAEPEEVNARARMLLSGIRTILHTQLRADDNVLKRRTTAQHSKMLNELKDLRSRMENGEDVRTIDMGT